MKKVSNPSAPDTRPKAPPAPPPVWEWKTNSRVYTGFLNTVKKIEDDANKTLEEQYALPTMKIYRIIAEDPNLEKTYRHKFDAVQELKKNGYKEEDEEWSKTDNIGRYPVYLTATIEEVEVL